MTLSKQVGKPTSCQNQLDDHGTTIRFAGDNPDNVEKIDKPHRAYAGIERLCAGLADANSGNPVKVRNRVVVWMGKWPEGSAKGRRLRDVYAESPIELWTREFLSPTIDCLTYED